MAESTRKTSLGIILGLLSVVALIGGLGLAGFYFYYNAGSYQPEKGPVEASSAEPEPARGIAGTVVDSTGAPIADANVSTTEGQSAATDGEGRFELPNIESGTYRFDASAEGYVTAGPSGMRRVEVTLSEGQAIDDLRLVLRRPVTLSGEIVAGGEPIAGANIGLYYLFAEGLTGRLEPFALDSVATSADDGGFELDGIAPGRFHVLVEADDYALAESQEVYLEPGEARDGFVIDLDPSALLTGEVVDQDGQTLDAELTLRGGSLARSRTAETGAQGKYVFRDISPGTYVLQARSDGYRTELIEDLQVSPDGPTQRNVVMKPASGIFGQVFTPDGEPAVNSFVYLEPDQGRRRVLRADDDGRFEWPDPPRPTYQATAVAKEYADGQPQLVRQGEEASLTLNSGGSVAGRVVGPDGQPVQSFSIGVESIEVDGVRPYRPRSVAVRDINDSGGRFRFDSLRPGSYWFRVQTARYASETSERVAVRAGADRSGLVIRVGAGGRVSGTVTDEQTGKPVAGAMVVVFDPSSPFAANQTRTGSDGNYTLEGVPPGRRSIRANKNGYLSTVAAGVNVQPNGTSTRDVQIRKQKPGERMQFHGIGAVLRKTDKGVRVTNVMEGHPAAEFGLESGDYIRSVDRESVEGMRLKSVIEQIRGQQGVPVELEIEREGGSRMTLEIERGRVVVKDRGGRGGR